MNKKLSIIVTVYQKEHQIDWVINSIINNTVMPFQLVIVYDGCTDKSEEVVSRTLALNSGNMRDFRIVYTPDVNEVRANNSGMKSADGDYFIIVQDDMFIVELGWEERLLAPILKWNDVFAVGANVAHSFSASDNYELNYSCSNLGKRDSFIIRDVINRGPIAFRADIVRKLNYLDEKFAPLGMDEMDLCMRAWVTYNVKCGVYGIGIKNMEKTLSPDGTSQLSTGEIANDCDIEHSKIFWERYHTLFTGKNHDEERPLIVQSSVRKKYEEKYKLIDNQKYGASACIGYIEAGLAFVKTGNLYDAELRFLSAIEADPTSIAGYHMLSETYFKMKRFEQALEFMKIALKCDPNDLDTVVNIAYIYKAMGYVNDAKKFLDLYSKHFKDSPQINEAVKIIKGSTI